MDAKYCEQAAGRPLRSHARLLTDGELLANLRSFGIDLDRVSLERYCDRALSAEEIAKSLLDQHIPKAQRAALESDWIWICLVVLWQRWFPDKPSFEILDDKMQAGYDLIASRNAAAACRTWLDAWTNVLHILDKARIQSIREFDSRFRGTQCLFNWIQDLEDELWNAGLEDRQFLTSRIAVCEEGLRRFQAHHDLMTENRRRALAESYYELGGADKTEALYREWLNTDPCWGWGWIGWSDCYRFTRTDLKDLKRCEELLIQGLAIPEVRDRPDLAERIVDLYEEQGRNDEAKKFWEQTQRSSPVVQTTRDIKSGGDISRQKTTITFGDKGRHKVGRNEPCPCGSGKKFKKCCGGRL